eukprot:gene8772-11847_t
MAELFLSVIILCLLNTSSGFHSSIAKLSPITKSITAHHVTAKDSVPDSVLIDLIEIKDGDYALGTEKKDFGTLLKSHKKAVLFGVPGAFTPTCSEKHLPGFIEKAQLLKEKGVEAVYCMSVNDKYVMKAWAQSTEGASKNDLKFIADGSAEVTKALKLEKDSSASGMGIRCRRFAAIIENGVFSVVYVDDKGLDKSSVESLLTSL